MGDRVIESGIGRRLFTNIGSNFAAQGVLLLLNFVTAPYIVHQLGAKLFGLVALVQTIAGFAGVLNIGIGRALTKYLSELYWKSDIKHINDLFQTTWAACLLSGIVGIIILIGFSGLIAPILFHGGSEIPEDLTTFSVYVAAVGLFLSMLSEAVSAIPVATQKFGIRNLIQVLVTSIWCIGSVLLLAIGYSIRSVLVINLLSNFIGIAALLIASKKIIPGLKLLPRISKQALRKLLVFSLPLMISAVTALVASRLDRLILAYYLPIAAVAFYTLPFSLSEKLTAAVSNVVSVVFPFASELHARDAHTKVNELYLHSFRTLMCVVLPITVVLATLPTSILQYWLGPLYAEQGSECLALLTLAAFVNSVSAVPTVTSLGIGRAWMPSIFSLITSSLDLALNFILIPRYGIIGAASALLLSNFAVVPFFLYAVNSALHLSMTRFFAQALLRPFTVAAVQTAFLLETRSYIQGIGSLLIVALASVACFALLSFFTVLNHRERAALYWLGIRLFTKPRPQ